MSSLSNDLIHCHKSKKKMKNIDSKIVQTNNGIYRIAAKCSTCETNKCKFIKRTEEEIKQVTKKKSYLKRTI